MNSTKIRRKTHEIVTKIDTKLDQWSMRKELFRLITNETKNMSDMIIETWDICIEDDLWKIKFKIKAKVIATLDNSLLQNIKRETTRNRDKKKKSMIKIKRRWESHVDNWIDQDLKENHLDVITRVARQFRYEKINRMIIYVIANKLARDDVNREFIEKIINKNWQKFSLMCETDVRSCDKRALIERAENVVTMYIVRLRF